MRKIYFIIAAAAMFFTIDASAQLGVGAGYVHGTTTARFQDDTESDGLDGFYIEAEYGLDIVERGWGSLALRPGLRFTYMGESDSDREMGITVREAKNETYLELPVNVRYSYDFSTVSLYAFAGPVFSLGLTSVSKTSMKGENIDYVVKYHNYTGKTITKGDGSSSTTDPDSYTDYGRFDVKLGLGVGVEFMESFNVKLGYNIGLLNRYTGDQLDEYKLHTGVFYVGLGFSF